jgi:hypothetical protein
MTHTKPTKTTKTRIFTWPESTYSFTWPDIARHTLRKLGGQASLRDIYAAIETHPRVQDRKHWRAKIRQVLESYNEFVRVDAGIWGFTERFSAAKVEKLRKLRRKQHPLLGPREKPEDLT